MELCEVIKKLQKLELYLGNCKKLRKRPKSFVKVASPVELEMAITRLAGSIGNQKL